MTLSQILLHHQILFAFIVYSIAVMAAIPLFEWVHTRLDHHHLQYFWDKIGNPMLRTLLLIAFILLVYPLNFGIEKAPAINSLLGTQELRFNFLINIVFILTFLFPLLPVIGKWDELIIPLQGMIASMIIFSWLCQAMGLKNYSLLPGLDTFSWIFVISFITHWLAVYIAEPIGGWLNHSFDRTGFKQLVFQGVVMIMQSPVIIIFGLALGKQLNAA